MKLLVIRKKIKYAITDNIIFWCLSNLNSKILLVSKRERIVSLVTAYKILNLN